MSAGGASPPADSFAEQAFAATADSYARSSEGWERAIHAAIATLFGFLAERPRQTSACIAAEHGAGPAGLDRRDHVIDRFTELLRPGFAATATPPPAVVAEAIGGGIYELVRSHVLEQRLEELPDAVPGATVVALSPFLGTASAIELASRKNVQATR